MFITDFVQTLNQNPNQLGIFSTKVSGPFLNIMSFLPTYKQTCIHLKIKRKTSVELNHLTMVLICTCDYLVYQSCDNNGHCIPFNLWKKYTSITLFITLVTFTLFLPQSLYPSGQLVGASNGSAWSPEPLTQDVGSAIKAKRYTNLLNALYSLQLKKSRVEWDHLLLNRIFTLFWYPSLTSSLADPDPGTFSLLPWPKVHLCPLFCFFFLYTGSNQTPFVQIE